MFALEKDTHCTLCPPLRQCTMTDPPSVVGAAHLNPPRPRAPPNTEGDAMAQGAHRPGGRRGHLRHETEQERPRAAARDA